MDIKFIELNRHLLQYYLGEMRNLRRELINYITSIENIWKNLPVEMPHEIKISTVKDITQMFVEEIDYGAGFIEQQYVTMSNRDYQSYALQFNNIKEENSYLYNIIENIKKDNADNLNLVNKEYKHKIELLKNEITQLKHIINLNEKKILEKEQELSTYIQTYSEENKRKDETLSKISYDISNIQKENDHKDKIIIELRNEILNLKQKNNEHINALKNIRDKISASIDKHKKDWRKTVPLDELKNMLQ